MNSHNRQASFVTFVKNISLADRLKTARDMLKLSQTALSEVLEVTPSYISKLESGEKTSGSRRFLERLAKFEAKGIHSLSPPTGDIMRDVQITVPRYIPVLTLAQAGNVLVAYENLPLHFAEKVPTDLADPKAFAIRVQGDSMMPHFPEGDRLIVSPAQEVRNGEIVLARFVNGDTVVKLYHESKGGREIQLASFNPAYPPKLYKRREFEAIVKVVQRVQDVSMDLIRRQF